MSESKLIFGNKTTVKQRFLEGGGFGKCYQVSDKTAMK